MPCLLHPRRGAQSPRTRMDQIKAEELLMALATLPPSDRARPRVAAPCRPCSATANLHRRSPPAIPNHLTAQGSCSGRVIVLPKHPLELHNPSSAQPPHGRTAVVAPASPSSTAGHHLTLTPPPKRLSCPKPPHGHFWAWPEGHLTRSNMLRRAPLPPRRSGDQSRVAPPQPSTHVDP